VETTYLHCDSSSFGWGAVLNNCAETRGFSATPDTEQHITYKELKAVKCAIYSFLPELKGGRILLHEDNQFVIGELTYLTARSPAMMCELRKLFLLIDGFGIKIRTTYIRSTANILADGLIRIKNNSYCKLKERKFGRLNKMWGPVSIDRFASFENKQTARHTTPSG